MNEEQFDEWFDQAFKEAIRENYEMQVIPDHTASWQKVKQELNRRKKIRVWKHRGQLVSAMILLLILGGVLFGNASLINAIQPAFEVIQKVQGEVVTFIFGTNNNDSGAKTSPPIDEQNILRQGDEFEFKGGGVLEKKIVTLQEAKQRVDFHIFSPEILPKEYELDRVELLYDENQKANAVNLIYRVSKEIIFITQRYLGTNAILSSSVQNPLAKIKEIEVGGNKAFLTEYTDGRANIQLMIGNLFVEISGQLTEEEIIAMTESLR